MTPAIRTVCREHFGIYRAGRQVTPNRCGVCPISAPCKTWCATPVRTTEELDAGRVRFVEAAEKIMGAT